MTSRILTTANQVTILRLVFVPIFAILVIAQDYRLALLVLLAAAISDVLDGTLARLLKQESALGVALDPIADKILMTTAYLTLAYRGVLPWWLAILVLSRDVAILMTALLIILVAGYRPFHPTVLGKASTAMQVVTVFVAMGFAGRLPLLTQLIVDVFVYLAAALTIASGIHYLIVVRQRYGQRVEATASAPSRQASNEQPPAGLERPSSSSKTPSR
jgi:cardiolipin synthase